LGSRDKGVRYGSPTLTVATYHIKWGEVKIDHKAKIVASIYKKNF
jgi:hypothetical protein